MLHGPFPLMGKTCTFPLAVYDPIKEIGLPKVNLALDFNVSTSKLLIKLNYDF